MFVFLGFVAAMGLFVSLMVYFTGNRQKKKWPLWVAIGCGILLIACIPLHLSTAQGERALKTFNSNITGGIVRTVDVYDANGTLIKTYEGRIDVQDTEYGNKVLFDLNGKRTIIYNATVVVQEK